MKKFLCLWMALLIIAGSAAVPGLAEDHSSGTMRYTHDPRENPEAMRDIVENPEAVYGFSPSPAEESTLKEYVDAIDWTNPVQVAAAREQRKAYHDSMDELYTMILAMVNENQDIETIARAVSQRRNELRLEAYRDDPDGLATVKKRNLETYGNEMGPTQDSLYEKYGSWEMVLIKALGLNPGMDACLGFYDDYYYMYDLESATGAVPEPAVEKTEEPQADRFRDIQYVLYLGTNDKDTNTPVFTQAEAVEKAREILLRHFGGYTIQEAHGGWIDGETEYQEYTLVLYLSDTTLDQVHAAADELLEVFRQSTVLIQENPTRTEFYSHGS